MENYKVKFKKLRNRELYSAQVAETNIRAKREQLEKIGELVEHPNVKGVTYYEVGLVTLLKQKSWNDFGADLFPNYWEGEINNGEEGTVKDQVERDLNDKKRLQEFYRFVGQFDEWEEPAV